MIDDKWRGKTPYNYVPQNLKIEFMDFCADTVLDKCSDGLIGKSVLFLWGSEFAQISRVDIIYKIGKLYLYQSRQEKYILLTLSGGL